MEHRNVQITGKWYALFSQTGQEIRELSEKIGRYPDVVLTTSVSKTLIAPDIQDNSSNIQSFLVGAVTKNDLVTLHGYKFLLSDYVLLSGARIWNGHPGLAPIYPELAGLDPQEKFFYLQGEKQYPILGSIVHEVTNEVDMGPLISVVTRDVPSQLRGRVPRETIYEVLRQTSMEAWLKALKGVL